ncbi:MAG: DMT family transporter, partial [Ilumatobacteraceae bacterium]|nr:DMT family transporter [Ilumatobacteraceae bacterium]
MNQIPASADTGAQFGTEEWAMSAAIALVWGASFLFIAIAIDYVATPVVPMARLFFGVMALLVIPSARKRIDRSDYKRVIFLGLVWMAIPFMLYPMAEESVSSAVAGMLNGGLPVMTVAVTAVFVRRRPSSQRIVSVLIGFLGITIISLSSIQDGVSASIHGVVYLIIALLC